MQILTTHAHNPEAWNGLKLVVDEILLLRCSPPTIMHILLVRHGQSTNNVIEAELGDCPEFYQRRVVDPALSSLGERQAAALARHVGAQLRQCAAQGRITLSLIHI